MASGEQFDAGQWTADQGVTWQSIEIVHILAVMNDDAIKSIVVRDDLTQAWRILHADRIESMAQPGDRSAIRDRELNAEIAKALASQLPELVRQRVSA